MSLKHFFYFLTSVFIIHLKKLADISLKAIVKVVHSLRVTLDNLDVFDTVQTVSLLDLIENIETFLELLIQLHVMDGLSHFSDALLKVGLLIVSHLFMEITTFGERHLEVDFCRLELLFVLIELGSKLFIKL